MSEYIPLYISLGLIFIIGGFIPLIISGFIDVSEPSSDSFIASISDFIDTGFTIPIFGFFNLSINPFGLFGEGFEDILISRLNAFSYLPNSISIPLLILILVGFVISLITIIKPFS